jgi:hypothetical protein
VVAVTPTTRITRRALTPSGVLITGAASPPRCPRGDAPPRRAGLSRADG